MCKVEWYIRYAMRVTGRDVWVVGWWMGSGG